MLIVCSANGLSRVYQNKKTPLAPMRTRGVPCFCEPRWAEFTPTPSSKPSVSSLVHDLSAIPLRFQTSLRHRLQELRPLDTRKDQPVMRTEHQAPASDTTDWRHCGKEASPIVAALLNWLCLRAVPSSTAQMASRKT